MSVSWFLFCRQVHLGHVLRSRYKSSPMVFVFLYLPSLTMRLSRSTCVEANAVISLFLMPDIPLCVSIEALLWGQHFGVQAPYIPCAPSRGSRAGSFLPRPACGGSRWPPPSHLCLRLLVVSPLVSLRRTLSLEGGPPSSRRTSSQTLPVASPLCLLCYGDTC